MTPDPGIDWIRAVRRTISHEVNNDPKEFVSLHRALRGKYERESHQADLPDSAQCRPTVVSGAPLR